MNEEYTCPKCGSNRVYIKQTAKYPGLYCSDCNAWIKWLKYAEILKINKGKMEEGFDEEKYAIKTFHKYAGVTQVRCSDCRTLLYTSDAPLPEGQFNLISAKFCPLCGKEFI